MRLGTDLGTLAELIIQILVCRSLRLAQQESRRLLGGFAVVIAQHVRIGLQKEPDVGVADPLADHFRAYPCFGHRSHTSGAGRGR